MTDSDILQARRALLNSVSWDSILSKPTTLAGFGISDAAALAHTHTFASLTSKPTSLAGYGITNAYTKAEADSGFATAAHTHAFSALTSKPTTLSGYGITDALPLAGGTLTGNLLFSTDALRDIGAAGATRPRDVHVGRSLVFLHSGGTSASIQVTSTNLEFGTITAQGMALYTNNTVRWKVDANGHLLANTDNVYDIGASGATRPRDLYLAGGVGFYGTAAIAKQTVTGSRGANAALASLCTALAAYGLIVNSTS